MKSLAEIVVGAQGAGLTLPEQKQARWRTALRAHEGEFLRPRLWKVSLGVSIFSDVVIDAPSVHVVDRLAEARADEAKVTLHTAPGAFRRFIQKRADPRNPESPLVWVEVVFGPIDPLDHTSPWAWHLKP